jgi:hypothetical protein
MEVEEGARQAGEEDVGLVLIAVGLGLVGELDAPPPVACQQDEHRRVGERPTHERA